MSSGGLSHTKERQRLERPVGPIRWRSSLRNAIYDVLSARPNWVETESDTEWDFFWADKGWIHHELDKMHLNDWQRINHFPNHYELTRKDLLIKNLKRAKKQLDREERYAEAAQYNFFPQTFVVPSEYRMFVEEFKRSGGTWIMKPIGKAQGAGIFLFNKLSQIAEWRRGCNWRPDAEAEEAPETYLAQRYVDQPYLVGGKKFDLRIYALVINYSPLQVYLYRSGFGRFTNTRYSTRKEDICNSYMHLTNVAIQKHAPGFDAAKGMKWSIRSLRMFMETRHSADGANELFHNIQNLIIRTLLAVQPAIINDKHCFELYGYDILIDAALKPWLIEVNASPSLSASDKADQDLKHGMLEDMLDVVDLDGKREHSARPALNVGGFDLIWDGGPVMRFNQPTSLPSLLGVYNSLDKSQLRKKAPSATDVAGPDRLQKGRPAAGMPATAAAAAAAVPEALRAQATPCGGIAAPSVPAAAAPLSSATSLTALMASSAKAGPQQASLEVAAEPTAAAPAAGAASGPLATAAALAAAAAVTGGVDEQRDGRGVDGVQSLQGTGVQGEGGRPSSAAGLGKVEDSGRAKEGGGREEAGGGSRGGAASKAEKGGGSGRPGDGAPSRPLHASKAGAGT